MSGDSARSARNGYVVLSASRAYGQVLLEKSKTVSHAFRFQLSLFVVDSFSYRRIAWGSLSFFSRLSSTRGGSFAHQLFWPSIRLTLQEQAAEGKVSTNLIIYFSEPGLSLRLCRVSIYQCYQPICCVRPINRTQLYSNTFAWWSVIFYEESMLTGNGGLFL